MESIVKHITNEATLRGFDVRIRDIAYALLRVKFNDELIAYTVVFGSPEKDNDVTDYESLDSTQYLIRWFKSDLAPKEIEKKSDKDIINDIQKNKQQTNADDGSITFEENRAGMEEQIREIREAITKGIKDETMDDKTFGSLQKTLADLRSKLNDKFGASEKTSEQYVIVQPKFNHICSITRRECWLQTKAFAMEHWHLIPDPNFKD